MAMGLKVEDTVMVTTGRSRGKTGKIIKLVSGGHRALVEKVNLVKRHARPTQKMPQGGIVEKEASIHISNLMIFCDKCKKPSRIAIKVLKNDKRVRSCHRCDEQFDKD